MKWKAAAKRRPSKDERKNQMNSTKILTLAILLLGITTFAVAQESAAPTEMSEEQKKVMANFQTYSTPTENHELMKPLAGNWNTEVTMWMAPGAPGETSQGTATAELIFGGRYLEQKFLGNFMNQPYEGRGLLGYDNIRKEFQNIWYDNMGTGIMVGAGQYDAGAKTFSEEGTVSCPITNSPRWHRSVTTIIDDNNYTYESFMKDPATDETFRSMLIKYTRQSE